MRIGCAGVDEAKVVRPFTRPISRGGGEVVHPVIREDLRHAVGQFAAAGELLDEVPVFDIYRTYVWRVGLEGVYEVDGGGDGHVGSLVFDLSTCVLAGDNYG